MPIDFRLSAIDCKAKYASLFVGGRGLIRWGLDSPRSLVRMAENPARLPLHILC
jgi:hypothetical protein